jgi:hypothetical protein
MQNGLCHGRGEPSALPHSTQHSTTKSSNSCSGWPMCTASTQGLCLPPAIIICRQHASRAAHAHVHCGSRPLHSLCCHACSDAACRALHHSATLSPTQSWHGMQLRLGLRVRAAVHRHSPTSLRCSCPQHQAAVAPPMLLGAVAAQSMH